jgi:hypothetical protein
MRPRIYFALGVAAAAVTILALVTAMSSGQPQPIDCRAERVHDATAALVMTQDMLTENRIIDPDAQGDIDAEREDAIAGIEDALSSLRAMAACPAPKVPPSDRSSS